jgi:hypothetical protein
MRQAVKEVEALKAVHASTAFADATDALARLKKESPRNYDRLLLTLMERPGGGSEPTQA